jgi:hypothetical protein
MCLKKGTCSRHVPFFALRLLQRDAEVIDALSAIVEFSPRWGFWKCFDRLVLAQANQRR